MLYALQVRILLSKRTYGKVLALHSFIVFCRDEKKTTKRSGSAYERQQVGYAIPMCSRQSYSIVGNRRKTSTSNGQVNIP